MARRDETTEQSITIEITGEARDAAAAAEITAFPVDSGIGIEVRSNEVVIELDIATVVCSTEEAIERRVVRQVAGGSDL